MNSLGKKSVLLILGILGVLTYLNKPSRKTQLSKVEKLPGKSIEILPPIKNVNQTEQSALIPTKRSQSLARMGVGGTFFKPTVDANGMQIHIEMRPIGRSCQNGDIDLITSLVGAKGNVRLVVQDSSDKRLVEKLVGMDQLISGFSLRMSLLVSNKLQIFRLSLCVDQGRDGCSRHSPIEFKKIEQLINRNAAQSELVHDALFYTQIFGTYANGIHLFDSTKERQPQAYRSYVSGHDGNDSHFEFLKSTLIQERRLGVLPIQIDDNRLIFPLYYNDKSRCEIAGQGERNEKQ